MGKIGITSFTERGRKLSERIEKELCREYEVLERNGSLKDWCRECFDSAEGIIFIGACGIAVRTIAPLLKSKTQDPAVVVIDEAGNFVISLLSGHIGGANEFAVKVAEWIGAVPVITTASDVNGKIAVDVFAKKNHLAIGSMRDAREIAAAILKGQRVGVVCTGKIQGEVPPELTLLPREQSVLSGQEQVDHLIWISEYLPDKTWTERYLENPRGTVLHLIPKNVILGVGCRRGKPEEEIQSVFEKVMEQAALSPKAVCAAASIDLKKEEQGILALCGKYEIPFYTYLAEELARVEGDFKASEFVKKTTGVDNVCERAALLAADHLSRDFVHLSDNRNGNSKVQLILRKYAENGVTAALAAREWSVRFEK